MATLRVNRADGFAKPKKRARVLYRNQWPKKRIDWKMPTKRTNPINV